MNEETCEIWHNNHIFVAGPREWAISFVQGFDMEVHKTDDPGVFLAFDKEGHSCD